MKNINNSSFFLKVMPPRHHTTFHHTRAPYWGLHPRSGGPAHRLQGDQVYRAPHHQGGWGHRAPHHQGVHYPPAAAGVAEDGTVVSAVA